jgi:hypothetical protein
MHTSLLLKPSFLADRSHHWYYNQIEGFLVQQSLSLLKEKRNKNTDF